MFFSAKPLIAGVLLACALIAVPAQGRGFDCRNGVVSEDLVDSKAQVLEKCGPPEYQDNLGAVWRNGQRFQRELWFYNPGKNDYTRALIFEGERLKEIRKGTFGY